MTATLPANPDAEASLIARLLIEPAQVSPLANSLRPEDFYDPDARAAYRAMLSLSERGEHIDVVTLKAEVGRAIDIDLFDLTAAHRAPLETYAEIVGRDGFRRGFLEQLETLERLARQENDPRTLISALQNSEAQLAERIGPSDVLGQLNLEEHRGAPPPPLLDVLSPHGTTVLYGDGGDGKGWVAARLLSRLKCKVAILDFEMQPQEWAYRLGQFGVNLSDFSYFAPSTTFDKWATSEAARLLERAGVEFLLVDSAMYASNVEDPYSPNGALAYGRARRRLNNLPALLLAHTTGNTDKVFGSVFWRNESRIVWRLDKDRLTRQRHMECRKANGYSWLEGRKYQLEFNEERGILNLHESGKPWTPQTEGDNGDY